MSKRKWTPLTPKQQFEKTFRDYDNWVKAEMLKHADEIEEMLRKMEEAK